MLDMCCFCCSHQITFLLRRKTQCDEKYIAAARQQARAYANNAENFLSGVSTRTYSLTGPCIDAAIKVSARGCSLLYLWASTCVSGDSFGGK